MNDTPIIDLKIKDCKLVRLLGGASDGVTTCVHRDATCAQRPQGVYTATEHRAGGLPVFKWSQS